MFGEDAQVGGGAAPTQPASRPAGAIVAGPCRYDDRAESVAGAGLLSAKPAVLRRRTVALVAVLGIAAIGYGALAPFHADMDRGFNWNPAWIPPSPGDSVANVLIYIPIGVFLRLLFRRRGSSRLLEVFLSLVIAGGISYFTEVVQSVIPARVCTWTDVVLNLGGAGLGVCIAPAAQRRLRNLHATLYVGLRTAPINMAAAAIALCVVTYALSPPDFYPSPHHVAQAWQRFTSPPAGWASWPARREPGDVSAVQVVDKLMTGGAYGLLAFVLLLAARETGRSLALSFWIALSRSVALAAAVEAAQLFTISHVADLRDLGWAWVCCLICGALGWLAAAVCPNLHRRPLVVLRGLVLVVAFSLLVWAMASVHLAKHAAPPAQMCWLPMINNFHRSWNGLLGDYVTGLLQYTLVAALLLLWYRAQRRAPWLPLVVVFTGSCAIVSGMVAVSRLGLFDTAQVFLAVAGAAIAIRMDRAVFGKPAAAGRLAYSDPP